MLFVVLMTEGIQRCIAGDSAPTMSSEIRRMITSTLHLPWTLNTFTENTLWSTLHVLRSMLLYWLNQWVWSLRMRRKNVKKKPSSLRKTKMTWCQKNLKNQRNLRKLRNQKHLKKHLKTSQLTWKLISESERLRTWHSQSQRA